MLITAFMSEDRIWELLAKKLAGEATPDELEELEDLQRSYPELHNPIQTLTDSWQIKPEFNEDPAAAFERHIDKMNVLGYSMDIPVDNFSSDSQSILRKSVKNLVWVIPVSLFIITALAWWLTTRQAAGDTSEKTAVVDSEISTRNGSRSKVVLPDGTQIWLNAGSKLNYSKNYGVTQREVNLSGEAYFDVTHDSTRPFIIHTAKMKLRVLGTTFNVKAYPHEKTSEASLISGKIEVKLNERPDKYFILKPKEKIIVSNLQADTGYTLPASVKKTELLKQPMIILDHINYWPSDNTILETSWMENRLVFRNETFREIANRMERRYAVQVVFEDEKLEQLRLTGNFQSETLVQALNALRITAPFRYRIKDNIVILSK